MSESAARLIRRAVDCRLSPVEVARAFRDAEGLCVLLGDWHRGGAIVAFDPVRVADGDPFELLDELDDAAEAGTRAFGGGWIGYWGYRLGSRVERLPDSPPRPDPLPDSWLAYYDRVLIYDGDASQWWYEALVPPERDEDVDATYANVCRWLSAPAPAARPYECGPFAMTPGPTAHREVIARTLEHIAAGDIFQSNLCVRLGADFAGEPLDLFCAGAEALRPRYGAYVSLPGGAVASFSPELFLRRRGRDVLTSPIKGTAALTSDARALASSYKNRAENIMIVDLMRNDLGRVCEPGSVRVPDQPRAERHTGVWHLVSDVAGRLSEGVGDGALVRATFPPGSVTGAPKVRAMEIIAELETTGREVYTGAIGYAGPLAGLELNVAIRTFEFSGDRVWLGVGGGIVADSRPDDELRECLVKATPLLDAIGAGVDDRTLAAVGPEPGSGPPSQPRAKAPAALSRPDPKAGVFETMWVGDGTAPHLEAHLDRLRDSVAQLYGSELPGRLSERIEAIAAGLAGPHRLRVALEPDGTESIATVPVSDGAPQPWRLVAASVPGGLGAHKWSDRELLSALGSSLLPADVDPLLLDGDDVLETGRGNIFVVDDHGVHTPELDGRILPGVTRRRVLDLLRATGVPAYERRITLGELERADEVFVTNAVRGAMPVTEVAGIGQWDQGHTTVWIAARLSDAQTGSATPAWPSAEGRRVLLIDNYDSFVYNLDQYCRELGASTDVVRNDAATVDAIERRVLGGVYDRIIISPGPGTPRDAGISTEVVRRLGARVPILGVCLGHQAIGEAYGARTVRAHEIVHGKLSLVHHDGSGVFAGLDGPLPAGRYHSLIVDGAVLPPELMPTAYTASGVLMGVRHRDHPVEGVQLHPESILTGHGHRILANFLA